MQFTNTTLANESTENYIGGLLKKQYINIQELNEYWRYEEEEKILNTCEQLGLNELAEELKNY